MRSKIKKVHHLLLIPALTLVLGMFCQPLNAQEDLLEMLDAETPETRDFTIATFKTTRIINGQSVETLSHGVMNFVIQHRFGRLNGGIQELFGLDNSTIRLGLEYGLTDRIDLSVGRSSFEKIYDGGIKYKLLRQQTGARRFPFSMTLFANAAVKTIAWAEPDRPNYSSSRWYFSYQALMARKFNDNLSVQLSPTLVHRNLVGTVEDRNDVFTLGIGGRYKITSSLSINAEYFWIPTGQIFATINGEDVQDSFSVGVDLETGGHIFQIHLTNSRGMVEKLFTTETTGKWNAGDIHFGFNVNRYFTLYDPHKAQTRKAERRQKKAEKASS